MNNGQFLFSSKVATIIVQRGTLKRAKILVAGTALCRVRTLYDENGKQLNEVKPGNPVEITGWRDELPGAGEQILELENEVFFCFFLFNFL